MSASFGQFQLFLLAGVTGSGKTEVYLRLVQQVIAREQALILVPEIALTPQPRRPRGRSIPAARVVSLHSVLAEGARSQGFAGCWEGRAEIVLGTRLSVFTPAAARLIVVGCEEHDASQRRRRRATGQVIHIWRACQRSVPIVPVFRHPASLESWHAADTGRYSPHRTH